MKVIGTCSLCDELTKELSKHNSSISSIKHIINTTCVVRENSDYKHIRSVIYFGDIAILSEKRFSQLTKWIYKKLFGWEVLDYHWGDPYQKRPFTDI